MRGDRDPVPPRHTFDDDSSSDDDSEPDPTRGHLEDYTEDQAQHPRSKHRKAIVTPENIHIVLSEPIKQGPRVLIAFGLVYLAKLWFGPHREVGHIDITGLEHAEDSSHSPGQLLYHEEQDVYTLGFLDSPSPQYWGPIAYKLLQSIEPSKLILLGSPSSIPSSHPISMLRTSATVPLNHQPLGGVPAENVPLLSNRRRVSPQDIQARIAAHKHHTESDDIPLLLPPTMVQGFEASFCSLAEIFGIPAFYFGVSLHMGNNLEKADLQRIVRKIDELLETRVTEAEVDSVVNSWHGTYRVKIMGEGFYI